MKVIWTWAGRDVGGGREKEIQCTIGGKGCEKGYAQGGVPNSCFSKAIKRDHKEGRKKKKIMGVKDIDENA